MININININIKINPIYMSMTLPSVRRCEWDSLSPAEWSGESSLSVETGE